MAELKQYMRVFLNVLLLAQTQQGNVITSDSKPLMTAIAW